MRSRHALSDAQWALICDLLPGRPELGGRPAADNRLFVDAVLFVAKTGIPWRDLPPRFGNWNSVWRRFDRWCAAGRWETLSAALGEPDLEELQLDSTTAKAHPCASGSRRLAGEKKRTPTSAAVSAAAAGDCAASFMRRSTAAAGRCG